MSLANKEAYYADIAYNHCENVTERTLKKCNDTLNKVELLQARNQTSASDEIAMMIKKLQRM